MASPKAKRIVVQGESARSTFVLDQGTRRAFRELRGQLEDLLDIQAAEKSLASSKGSISWDDYLKKRG